MRRLIPFWAITPYLDTMGPQRFENSPTFAGATAQEARLTTPPGHERLTRSYLFKILLV
jgi:hypothetical protein